MIYVIVGHRGVGKTHWLRRISSLYKEDTSVGFFDLDTEVEKASQKTIEELFAEGEQVFRSFEQKVFSDLIKQDFSKIFVAAGAGFTFKKSKNMRVIHLSRQTDKDGRLFIDRPALFSSDKLFDKTMDLYKKREEYYQKQCDETLTLMEHFTGLQVSDEIFLGRKQVSKKMFSLTLDPSTLPKDKLVLQEFLKKRLGWGIRFFEVKDEDLPEETLKIIEEILPQESLLYSSHHLPKMFKKASHWSWDISLGSIPKGVSILSWHERGDRSLTEILEEFSKYKGYHLKLAVEIRSLEELWQAWCWQKEASKDRSFLPRSPEGRWKWFRLAFGPQMLVYFIRESCQGVLDQPLFSEACHYQKPAQAFGGVLGDPVDFSATPSEQDEFFYRQRSIPILPIPLKEGELR